MAEVQDKTINALDEATIINNSDITPIVQAVGSNYVTKKAELGDIGDHIATDMTFSDLQTTSKNLVGAINEASQNGGASEITELDDVNINSSTLANGDALVYDSTSSKWVNGEVTPGAVDLSDLGDVAISSPSNDQVLKYNSTSEKWENGAGGGGGASSLDDLSDVVISSPTANQVLKYDDISGKWENAAESAGVLDLDDLTDVSISSPSDGQVLTYDSNSSTWINSSGGSGSGGHTIVDSAGIDLAQRSNLQFIGAYSEDNSTDDTTEVNIVRSMTKAEFDLLSDDEKIGIINVTDEICTGLKYVKTVLYTNIDEDNWTAQSAGDSIALSDNILDYDEVYFETGFFEANNASGKKLTHLLNNKISAETIALAKSKYGTGSYEGMFDICPIALVSGQTYAAVFCLQVSADSSLTVKYKYINGWNASLWGVTRIIGVKYLSEDETIYSTNEHIVATWIDGRPIYEKTIAISESNFVVGWKWFTANLTCDQLIDSEVWLKDSGATYCYTNLPVAIQYSDGSLGINNNMGGTMGNVSGYVTVRYTKATS